MAAVLVEELGGAFVAALAEEIGFADGLVGQWGVESEGERRNEKSRDEKGQTRAN
jgi:hypothetical protein